MSRKRRARDAHPKPRVFVVHHNPNNGRYRYPADPTDALESARALLKEGKSDLAGNCRRLIHQGDMLLFKFGGSRLRQEPGIYAAARVTEAQAQGRRGRSGVWSLQYRPDARMTWRLISAPIIGKVLGEIVPRSFGPSIQQVEGRGLSALARWLDDGEVPATRAITHGLPIRKPYVDQILAGTKTWEIRGKATARRGPIALIESKSGTVVGTCEIVGVVGSLTWGQLKRNAARAGGLEGKPGYSTIYVWVVRNARRLPKPIPYRHPSGAVIGSGWKRGWLGESFRQEAELGAASCVLHRPPGLVRVCDVRRTVADLL